MEKLQIFCYVILVPNPALKASSTLLSFERRTGPILGIPDEICQ